MVGEKCRKGIRAVEGIASHRATGQNGAHLVPCRRPQDLTDLVACLDQWATVEYEYRLSRGARQAFQVVVFADVDGPVGLGAERRPRSTVERTRTA